VGFALTRGTPKLLRPEIHSSKVNLILTVARFAGFARIRALCRDLRVNWHRMARVLLNNSIFRRSGRTAGRSGAKAGITKASAAGLVGNTLRALAVSAGALLVWLIFFLHARYTFGLQSPVLVRLQSPVVVSRRSETKDAKAAQVDQHHGLTAYQQYACSKFGPDCRVALAIQRVENPQGKCEIYHYNPDGTLDWGYFQINTVHLKRPGLNLRDLLDCKANIDFAYRLYTERGFKAWSTYNTGAFRRALMQ